MILLLPFIPIAILLIVTPGPDTALVTRNGFRGGRSSALLTSLGVVSGLFVWTAAAAFGVATVLEANALAFTALKLAGAAYLAYMGIRALLSVRKGDGTPDDLKLSGNRLALFGRMKSPFLQGLLSDILNPKTAVVFTSLILQFITPGPTVGIETAELGSIFASMALGWLAVFSIMVGATGSFLRNPRIRKTLEAVTGIVLIGLGIEVATETR